MEKRDIALAQLKSSAKLYDCSDFISSITLSGAAEEILGKIAKKRNGINQLDIDIEYQKEFYKYFTGQQPNKKYLIAKINEIKNELKHNDIGENIWVSGNFENEAAVLFVKAVKNYFNAYQEFPKDELIKNLFLHLTQ